MAVIYARLIVKDVKKIDDVPESLQADVRKILKEWGYEE